MGEKEKRQEGHHHTLCEAPVLRDAIKSRGEPALCGITPPRPGEGLGGWLPALPAAAWAPSGGAAEPRHRNFAPTYACMCPPTARLAPGLASCIGLSHLARSRPQEPRARGVPRAAGFPPDLPPGRCGVFASPQPP